MPTHTENTRTSAAEEWIKGQQIAIDHQISIYGIGMVFLQGVESSGQSLLPQLLNELPKFKFSSCASHPGTTLI
jgi:hypothetical protein